MRILFVDGTKDYSPGRLGDQPTGGIATSLTLIPRYLASKGHDVWVKSVHDKDEKVAGVNFLSRLAPAPTVDFVVLNRNLVTENVVSQVLAQGATPIWWLHDMVDFRYLQDGAFKKIEHIVSLSQYCMDTYSEFYSIQQNKFKIIPNGIDPEVWFPGDYADRDPNLFVFASAPIKGYAPLQFVMHNLRRALPKLDFRIYSSQGLHGLMDSSEFGAWLKGMAANGATVSPPTPQKDLADVFRKAWCLLMPNDYPEMNSNLLLQAWACGLPVVTSPVGSNAEYIEHGITGMLTQRVPHDRFAWWADYARQVMALVTSKEVHKQISAKTPSLPLTWEQVGGMWEEYLIEIKNA